MPQCDVMIRRWCLYAVSKVLSRCLVTSLQVYLHTGTAMTFVVVLANTKYRMLITIPVMLFYREVLLKRNGQGIYIYIKLQFTTVYTIHKRSI